MRSSTAIWQRAALQTAWASPAQIFSEYASLTARSQRFGKDLDLTAFADADYDALTPTQWPVGKPSRFFADGGFYHADGKARMVPVVLPVLDPTTFWLNIGRIRDQ